MRILFDQGTPKPLSVFLPSHSVRTAFHEGWSELSNGELLAKAEAAGFELLLSTDQNLRYQQNLAGRLIRVLVLPTTKWPEIKLHTAEIALAVSQMCPGEYRELRWNQSTSRG